MHNMQSVLLGENPLGGGLIQAKRKTEQLGDLATILTPDEPVTPTPTGVAGPLPEGIVGLVLGCSSLSEKKKRKKERKKKKREREKKNFGGAWCSRF